MNILVDETCRELNGILQEIDYSARVYWRDQMLMVECFPCEAVARVAAFNEVLQRSGSRFIVLFYGLANRGSIQPVPVTMFKVDNK